MEQMVEDCFFDHDYCTLVVNGSKTQLLRRSLRLTHRELDRLLHTYAGILWQRYSALLKRTTTGKERGPKQASRFAQFRTGLVLRSL